MTGFDGRHRRNRHHGHFPTPPVLPPALPTRAGAAVGSAWPWPARCRAPGAPATAGWPRSCRLQSSTGRSGRHGLNSQLSVCTRAWKLRPTFLKRGPLRYLISCGQLCFVQRLFCYMWNFPDRSAVDGSLKTWLLRHHTLAHRHHHPSPWHVLALQLDQLGLGGFAATFGAFALIVGRLAGVVCGPGAGVRHGRRQSLRRTGCKGTRCGPGLALAGRLHRRCDTRPRLCRRRSRCRAVSGGRAWRSSIHGRRKPDRRPNEGSTINVRTTAETCCT